MAKLLILDGPDFNLLGVGTLFVEVHLFNVFAHKSFRHHSYQFGMAVGVISGLHGTGYALALQAAGIYLLRCLRLGIPHGYSQNQETY